MALTDGQKHLAYLLVSLKPNDAEYAIRIANDAPFAVSELIAKSPQLHEELLKEKSSHEAHIVELNTRLGKIASLITTIEELQNGNE